MTTRSNLHLGDEDDPGRVAPCKVQKEILDSLREIYDGSPQQKYRVHQLSATRNTALDEGVLPEVYDSPGTRNP